MEQVIATDDLSFRVREKREGVTGFTAQTPGDVGSVDADGHRAHAGIVELGKVLLDAS
jgi:hypothetical protein